MNFCILFREIYTKFIFHKFTLEAVLKLKQFIQLDMDNINFKIHNVIFFSNSITH